MKTIGVIFLGALLALRVQVWGADGVPGADDKNATITVDYDHGPALLVIDEQGKSHTVSSADLSKLTRHEVTTTGPKDAAKFEGVSLVDLLSSQGVSFGKDLKGPRAANVILLEAQDGYRVPIAMLEIDPATTDKLALVAEHRDGKLLDEKEGPFRLVIPDDKRPVRWIRMLKTIRVVNLKDLPLDDAAKMKPDPQAK